MDDEQNIESKLSISLDRKSYNPIFQGQRISWLIDNLRNATIKTMKQIYLESEYSDLKKPLSQNLHKIDQEKLMEKRRELSIKFQNHVIDSLKNIFIIDENNKSLSFNKCIGELKFYLPIYMHNSRNEVYDTSVKKFLPNFINDILKSEINIKPYLSVIAQHRRLIENNKNIEIKVLNTLTKISEIKSILKEIDISHCVMGIKEDKFYHYAVEDPHPKNYLPEFQNYNPETDEIIILNASNKIKFEKKRQLFKDKLIDDVSLITRSKFSIRVSQKINDYIVNIREDFPYDFSAIFVELENNRDLYKVVDVIKKISMESKKYRFEVEYKPNDKELFKVVQRYPDAVIDPQFEKLSNVYNPENYKIVTKNAKYAANKMSLKNLSLSQKAYLKLIGVPQVQVNFYSNKIRFEALLRTHEWQKIAENEFGHTKNYYENRDIWRQEDLKNKDVDLIAHFYEQQLMPTFESSGYTVNSDYYSKYFL